MTDTAETRTNNAAGKRGASAGNPAGQHERDKRNTLERHQVPLLGLLQATYISAMSIILSVSALSVVAVGGSTSLSTVSFALLATGLGITAYFGQNLIVRVGYRNLFFAANVLCIVAGITGAQGVATRSVALLFAGSFIFGLFQGAANYYRYAASDQAVTSAQGQRGIYLVLSCGIVAAVVGPQLISASTTTDIALSSAPYYMIAALGAVGATISLAIRLESANGRRPVNDQDSREATPDWYGFAVGCVSTLLGYSAMTLVMTAGPLASTDMHGHSHGVPAMMQLHFLAMFAPMLLLPLLSRVFRPSLLITTGAIIGGIGSILAALNGGMLTMMVTMITAGAAWAFTYGPGSAQLAASANASEFPRIRGMGELFPAIGLAVGALLAGPVMETLGWAGVNYIAAALLLVVLVAIPTLELIRRLKGIRDQ